MAKIEIESAFIESWTKNEEQHPTWGMKTAEPHSRKNDAGKYETVGRTFRTVKVSRASGIGLTEFRKGDRVHIWGTEVTEGREHDGKKFYDIVVWADRIELAGDGKGSAAPSASPQAQVEEPWAVAAPGGADDVWNSPSTFADETPF